MAKKRNDEQCANCESSKVKYFCYECGDRFCQECGSEQANFEGKTKRYPSQCPSPAHEAPELEEIK